MKAQCNLFSMPVSIYATGKVQTFCAHGQT